MSHIVIGWEKKSEARSGGEIRGRRGKSIEKGGEIANKGLGNAMNEKILEDNK